MEPDGSQQYIDKPFNNSQFNHFVQELKLSQINERKVDGDGHTSEIGKQ